MTSTSTGLRLNDLIIGNLIVTMKEHPKKPLSPYVIELMEHVASLLSTPVSTTSNVNQLNEALQRERELREQIVRAERQTTLANATGDFAHVVNNAIGIIESSINTAAMYQRKGMADKVHEKLEIIRGSTRRMGSYSARLLKISRAGRSEITTINLPNEVKSYLNLYTSELEDAHIKLDVDIGEGVRTVKQKDLLILIDNLMTNSIRAVKAQPAGYQGHIAVSAQKVGDELELKVSDNGVGIPESIKDRLFKDTSITTKKPGEGVGGYGLLSIAHICEQNKARYSLESEVGEGTTFTMYLPLEDQA